MNVLVLNAGSSSLKFQVISTDPDRIRQDTDERLCRGAMERIGGEAIVTVETKNGPRQKFTAPIRDVAAGLDYVLRWLASDRSGIDRNPQRWAISRRWAIAWCMAAKCSRSRCWSTTRCCNGIEDCIDLAPLHNPNNLRGIRAVRELIGRETPQVAVFDTAFHSTIPEQAYLYALPYHLYRRHRIRRYGFHGTSHRYVAYRYRMLRNSRASRPT
jgi:acetate kinase